MPVTSRDAERDPEFLNVWNGADRSVLSFGVGMSELSTREHRIRETIARGVDIHVVMVDPEWVLRSPEISAIYDDFYRQEGFAESFREAHSKLHDIAVDVNESADQAQLRIHTYRSVITQSATIADPGTSLAFGHLELHTYGRYMDRIRTTLPGIDGQGLLLAQCLRSISNLAGYNFTNSPHGAISSPLLAFA